MEPVDNNQFEVKLNTKTKRKIATPCPNAYLNPGLDLLANEDPMCNTAMEIVPNKKRKRTRSCDIVAFENSALDLGISKAAVNEFLVRELENVRRNLKSYERPIKNDIEENPEIHGDTLEPVYANLTDISIPNEENITNPCSEQDDMNIASNSVSDINKVKLPQSHTDTSQISKIESDIINDIEMESDISAVEHKSINTATGNCEVETDNMHMELSTNDNAKYTQTNVTNQIFINNTSNLSLSFIDRLALDSPNLSNQSLYLDDDLNESNIMEIKTITIITKKKRIPDKKKYTNPFLDPNINDKQMPSGSNPFLNDDVAQTESEYSDEVMTRAIEPQLPSSNLLPRRLFVDTNSTISTVSESSVNIYQNEYENIDSYRTESPIYENLEDETIESNYNKQSKILGHDVSQFNAIDIMNLNKITNQTNSSNDSNDSKKDFKHQILKASNKLSKKVIKTLKKTFKSEKSDKPENNISLNPYEVPRKPPKQKVVPKESGIENPALNLDNSDEISIEEIDDDIEHQYETIKTIRNTRLNMNVTPLRERVNDNIDLSSHSQTNTPGKKVRFDSTLNQEKVITGNSFDCDIQSPGFDAKIDKYHDELENCINEKKFIQQNM